MTASKGFEDILTEVAEGCTLCGTCRVDCGFLRKYGLPGELASSYKPGDASAQSRAFECSLCGLCTAVCPEGVRPAQLFLEMRREAVRRGTVFPEHDLLRGYERRGTSRRYTFYAQPEGCDTVLFPGCTLSGTRPHRVEELYDRLKQKIPALGIVLDCCSKPSHDLGEQARFEAYFGELRQYLLSSGVTMVLVACPNCFKVFRNYGDGISVKSVYEVLTEIATVPRPGISGTVTVQDPCAIRFEKPVQASIRSLIAQTGLSVEEMEHTGQTTLCCGEGGAVPLISPGLAGLWTSLRAKEARGMAMVTCCAGCVNMLDRATPTIHVLDLVFDPAAAMSGSAKVSKAPMTYLNRLRLKGRLKRTVPAAITRERTFEVTEEKKKGGLLKPLMLVAFIAIVLGVLYGTGFISKFNQESVKAWLIRYEHLAPLFYIGLYAVAPVLFLPGLPITIAGGIIFGPVWGVVYTIIGATTGASFAFLVSRYFARDWIASKLRGPKWRQLDDAVERQGWKAVAITRLIPIFPFNLLNYAFGLTKVPFWHYALTSFVCMLPATVAYIVFSSSLLDLIKGKVSPAFVIGLLLIVLVSLIPVFYRKMKKKQGIDETL